MDVLIVFGEADPKHLPSALCLLLTEAGAEKDIRTY